MAATRKKSAKRTTRKQGTKASKKRTKGSTKSSRKKATSLQKRAKKGLRATWKTLKSTTAQVVEGVKETLATRPVRR
jgi:hypothetical protein